MLFCESIENNAIPEGFEKEYTFDDILAEIKFDEDFEKMSELIEEKHIKMIVNEKAKKIMSKMTKYN